MLSPDPNTKKLESILKKKSYFLEMFKEATISGFSNSELIGMAKEVNAYWKDLQRPTLASLSCEAVGGQPSIADEPSLFIGLVVAGMGIHDDMIDKSESKHFRRTILGKHGPDKALLFGDLLIIKGLFAAQEYLLRICPLEKKTAISVALRNFIFEIYDGECMEISLRKNLDIELEDYLKIMWKLTADAEVCAKIGAILGGGTKDEISALSEFGRRLGFVMTLCCEIRDVLNEDIALSHRLENESVPLPILYAAKTSKKLYLELKSILENPLTRLFVFDIQKLCWSARSMEYINSLAKENARQATQSLEALTPGAARDALAFMMNIPLTYIKKAQDLEKKYVKYGLK